IDAQTIAPGNEYLEPVNWAFGDGTVNPDTTFAFALIAGAAGYQTGAPDDEHFTGDVIFHCHLFPHYGLGMWSIMRVLDRVTSPYPEIVVGGAEDNSGGNALMPVGEILRELPDSDDETPVADDFQPGFPYFIESRPDGGPKRPPDEQNSWGRPYTDLEWRSTNYYQRAIDNGNLYPDPTLLSKPGAPYDDPCPPYAPIREYNISSISDDIIYNKFGHHDPDGRIYVLDEQKEQILNGSKEPEPLVIRAELGECIEITFNNLLEPPAGFDEGTTLSMHPHFVGFDVLGSDGTPVGYDYFQANRVDQTISHRWYADEEGNIFWHDHISGIEKGMHGTGSILVVEPANSDWLDPETSQELEFPTSTEIMVVPEYPGAFEPFREFVIFYADFQELFDANGDPINMMAPNLANINENNPASDPNAQNRVNIGAHPPSSLHDHGVMSINYRNEPLWERIQTALDNVNPEFADDPAYVFSSNAHGDPSTHIFKAYSNDPVKIRLIAQSHEEMHNFVLNGLHPTGFGGFVPPFLGMQAQTVAASEQFNFNFIAPTAVMERNDYMYSSYPTNDIFNGMWGLIRIWCNENSLENDPQFSGSVQLAPLPGIEPVNCNGNMESNGNNDDEYNYNDNINAYEKEQNNVDNTNIDQTLTIQQFQNIGELDRQILLPFDLLEQLQPEIPQLRLLEPQTPPQRGISPGTDNTDPLSSMVEKIAAPTGLRPITMQNLLDVDAIPQPHNSCTPDAKERVFDVVAIQKDIILNDNDDSIPHGIIFVLKEDLNATLSGEKPLEPLVIRANVGECVIVNLENNLPIESMAPHDHPLQPGECNEHVQVACLEPNEWPTSNRVSLHPDNLFYDVGAFDGTNMGFNLIDQTVGPGETITYTWQAEKTGTNVLTDFGDLRGHRHHGGYGMLIVEPENAQYLDINTHQPIRSGAAADIVFPYGYDNWNFREFVLTLGSSHYIITKDDPELCILPPEEEEEEGVVEENKLPCNQDPVNDPEDQGYPAINYRSEPFIHRLLDAGEQQPVISENNQSESSLRISEILAQIMSSRIHGDPSTPILKVPEGKQTVLRVADVGDSPRGFAFHVAGHLFLRPAPISLAETDIPPGTPFQPFIERGTTQALTPSRSFSLEAVGGAGGLQDKPGDYLYQDQKLQKFVEGGAWGILRVVPEYFDPVYALDYLKQEILYSYELNQESKNKLIDRIDNAILILTLQNSQNDKQLCNEILSELLRELDEIENQNNRYQYNEIYDSDSASYDDYFNYQSIAYHDDTYFDSEYNNYNYNYKEDKKYNSNEVDRFKEIIRNIAYILCP
ncbi:MAG: hypothetical protein ACPKPY_07010, partial [Nitrososphaeraceae archaeon]